MITSDRFKEIFHALKLHFTSSYNYCMYQGKIKHLPKPKHFDYEYKKLAKRLVNEQNAYEFVVANILAGHSRTGAVKPYIGDFAKEECFEIWRKYQQRNGSLSYTLEADLAALQDKDPTIKSLVEITDGTHPGVLKEYMGKRLSPESIACILLVQPKLAAYWLKNSNDPILLPDFVFVMQRYSLLLNIDAEKLKSKLLAYK